MATDYLALPVDVVNPGDPYEVISDQYDWHFLAEGDSWFTIAAIPSSNLLLELQLGKWTQILNLAYPGDTLKNVSNLAKNRDLKRVLAKQNFNSAFDALLLSGGGNDVLAAAPTLIRTRPPKGAPASAPESYIDTTALAALVQGIQDGFKAIATLRDSKHSLSQGKPIFVHTYDYVTPRNAPARFLGSLSIAGPWLYKVFENSGIDIVVQQKISNHLIDQVAAGLLELDCSNTKSQKALPAFHVIDTRNTLVMANPTEVGNSNDWINEIHPNLRGYRKISARLSAAINEVLLG